jgi:hypothetical protein
MLFENENYALFSITDDQGNEVFASEDQSAIIAYLRDMIELIELLTVSEVNAECSIVACDEGSRWLQCNERM